MTTFLPLPQSKVTLSADTVFLGLGSNLGNAAQNLAEAIQHIAQLSRVLAQSPVYETAPMYVTDQPSFLNQVIAITPTLDPLSLLHALKEIERVMGRVVSQRYGPRLIDLDILFYGQHCLTLEDLSIPHPGIPERLFVLAPMMALAPTFRCPRTHKTIEEMHAYHSTPSPVLVNLL